MSLLNALLPTFDRTRVERVIIAAPVHVAYRAAMSTDLANVAREHLGVRLLFAIRSGIERAVAFARGRQFVTPVAPAAMRLKDMATTGTWVRLGENPPLEIAFGAIGRFWEGETRWLHLEPGEFTTFSPFGYAKLGCTFSFVPLDESRTLLTYEARTYALDETSRRGFLRYWRLASPFVGVVMCAAVSAIRREAEDCLPAHPPTLSRARG